MEGVKVQHFCCYMYINLHCTALCLQSPAMTNVHHYSQIYMIYKTQVLNLLILLGSTIRYEYNVELYTRLTFKSSSNPTVLGKELN
jgi:hypothetical protein